MPIKVTRHKLLNQRHFFKEENSFQLYIFSWRNKFRNFYQKSHDVRWIVKIIVI